MRLDRLTSKFQLALADAQSLALGRDNQFIEPIHLMSAHAGRGNCPSFTDLCWH
jgi:ATP-dependent Clp protease ATP-binding subunit ClpA